MLNVLILYLKGIVIGISDIIPGISGGSMAFILGVYEKLLSSLAAIFKIERLKELRTLSFRKLAQAIDLKFLLILELGIICGLFVFSHLITWALATIPISMWAFFFTVVLISASLIFYRKVPFALPMFVLATLGCALGLFLTLVVKGPGPVQDPSIPIVFLHGGIAISAMLLPGISGSYLLLILGSYEYILTSLKNLNIDVIVAFSLGSGLGIMLFSNFFHYLMSKFYSPVTAFLIGIMFGSLPAIWPWRDSSHTAISPMLYAQTLGDPQFLQVFIAVILALIFVFYLDWIQDKKHHS